MKQALYTFNWNEGGFNQVWANTKAEALREIQRQFTHGLCCLTPNLKSFKRLTSRKAIEAYWRSLPLMD